MPTRNKPYEVFVYGQTAGSCMM